MGKYGQPSETVEAEYLEIINASRASHAADGERYNPEHLGRRKIQ
jgi:hypothetical protein